MGTVESSQACRPTRSAPRCAWRSLCCARRLTISKQIANLYIAERLSYLGASEAAEVTTLKLRIAELDAEVTVLYSAAQEQYHQQVAKDLTIGTSRIRIATNETEAVRNSIVHETKRHSDAMLTLIALQEKSGATLRDAVKTIEGAAENLIYRWRRGAGNRARGRGCRCRELD